MLRHIYKGRSEVSAREAKELTPIANLIKRLLPKEEEEEEAEKQENIKENDAP